MIAEKIDEIKGTIPNHVTLVAVSKTKPNSLIEKAYAGGQRIFGENKVQELVDKYEALPKDIEWHMIGHLQRNKVKYIAPFVSLIHGVDSYKLLKEINKQGKKCGRKIPVLIQFHIAQESSKFGFTLEEFTETMEQNSLSELENIDIQGVMGMASFTSDQRQVADEFHSLKSIFKSLQKNYFPQNNFKTISMGMSGDYKIAIEFGSTMIRVGSTIFGKR